MATALKQITMLALMSSIRWMGHQQTNRRSTTSAQALASGMIQNAATKAPNTPDLDVRGVGHGILHRFLGSLGSAER